MGAPRSSKRRCRLRGSYIFSWHVSSRVWPWPGCRCLPLSSSSFRVGTRAGPRSWGCWNAGSSSRSRASASDDTRAGVRRPRRALGRALVGARGDRHPGLAFPPAGSVPVGVRARRRADPSRTWFAIPASFQVAPMQEVGSIPSPRSARDARPLAWWPISRGRLASGCRCSFSQWGFFALVWTRPLPLLASLRSWRTSMFVSGRAGWYALPLSFRALALVTVLIAGSSFRRRRHRHGRRQTAAIGLFTVWWTEEAAASRQEHRRELRVLERAPARRP